ncbi:uncharacterized protein BO72DRAFT_435161 [Aspergillus fijiensis CBS 313.89]|uniref:Prolyl 4-hydroxylase alpha subunit Fe(2+) 2OG dioxygenase domain-containing protein n=1 Tax=Aspergillus fijiensis CBS 313.89 TaxID=1448319 RepID=A0A8G1RMD9_9EURO|nr:uncharacterized protein BO72DRAFT_435161 [Aspergillus fijiensis CBS 313.89]RAK74440.1 hypothetical protein BO72DRAFT_435161 [Aspergillus fijiensis CBS 313.89]
MAAATTYTTAMSNTTTTRKKPALRPPNRADSRWKTIDPVPLTRESFLDLLYGRTPVIQVPRFIDQDLSARSLHYLLPRFTPYLHATGPPVEKVGLAQFEFQAQSAEDFTRRTGNEKAQYFSEVSKLGDLHARMAAVTGTNLWQRTVAAITALVAPEWEVGQQQQQEQQQYFSGIFRSINRGTPIHCDWCPYDCLTEDWILSRITHQAVFNLYLSSVADGGDTTIYDVQWSPEALRYRDPASYGYAPELVAGRDHTRFHPEAGDLYIFNSRNMHEVAAVEEKVTQTQSAPPRVALASFMGLLPAEVTGGKPRLMFWS